MGEMNKIVKVVPEGRRLGQFQDMVQMKLTGCLHPFDQNPLFQTVFHWKGRGPIGQDHLMPSFF
jgi:hypothetical protein